MSRQLKAWDLWECSKNSVAFERVKMAQELLDLKGDMVAAIEAVDRHINAFVESFDNGLEEVGDKAYLEHLRGIKEALEIG